MHILNSIDIKVRQFFERLHPRSSRDEAIIKHMVGLCRELRIQTIAEMVETPEAARVALDIGVGLGQGWCFAKPSAELVYPLPVTERPVPPLSEVATTIIASSS